MEEGLSDEEKWMMSDAVDQGGEDVAYALVRN